MMKKNSNLMLVRIIVHKVFIDKYVSDKIR